MKKHWAKIRMTNMANISKIENRNFNNMAKK